MSVLLHHAAGEHHLGATALALGVFDGVHLGHQALIRDTVALAAQRGVASCVLTFDRDPDQVVTPESAAPQLTTVDDKLELIATLGPDAILVVTFDASTAALSPSEFLERVVFDACRPSVCVVGRDFRFGSGAAGDVSTLRTFGLRHDFAVVAHDLVELDGATITSSRIRALVAAGAVADAARLLGRAHRVHGRVVHGRQLGRALGTPTANLDIDGRFALPADGVYAAWATVPAGRYPAAVSVGTAPSFPEATCVLEALLVGFEGDLYDAAVTIEFVERLREQRAFGDLDSLAAAITADAARVGEMLGRP